MRPDLRARHLFASPTPGRSRPRPALGLAAITLVHGVGLSLGIGVPPARAQHAGGATSGDEVRIGYVDLQRAIFGSNAGREARKALDERTDRLKKDFERREEELRRLRADYLRQSAVLSPEARAEKERELQVKTRELQRLQQDYEDELNRKDADLSKRILGEVREVVKQIGGKGSYTLILEKNSAGVLYAANGIDLTDEVIKAYNASSIAKGAK
jgi:outer membrane protein